LSKLKCKRKEGKCKYRFLKINIENDFLITPTRKSQTSQNANKSLGQQNTMRMRNNEKSFAEYLIINIEAESYEKGSSPKKTSTEK
jgi:hypothetical protein